MSRISASPHTLAALLSAALGVALGVGAHGAQAGTFSSNLALTSDYVWRGSTQSRGDPAAQAGFKFTGDSGLYASVWGSSVEFAPEVEASAELDFTLGWSHALDDDWAFDLNVLRYQYPATKVDLNWTELNGTLTYKNMCWVSAGWSNQALGYDLSGLYTQLGAKFPLNERVRFEAMLSHYLLSKDVVPKSGYTHAQANAVWIFHAPFELRLSAHATDAHAKAIFGDDFAGSRVEAALQAAF